MRCLLLLARHCRIPLLKNGRYASEPFVSNDGKVPKATPDNKHVSGKKRVDNVAWGVTQDGREWEREDHNSRLNVKERLR